MNELNIVIKLILNIALNIIINIYKCHINKNNQNKLLKKYEIFYLLTWMLCDH